MGSIREVMMKKDLVNDVVAEIRAAAPDIPLERAEAIAIGIRRDWRRNGSLWKYGSIGLCVALCAIVVLLFRHSGA